MSDRVGERDDSAASEEAASSDGARASHRPDLRPPSAAFEQLGGLARIRTVGLTPAAVLSLQRAAGNRAVGEAIFAAGLSGSSARAFAGPSGAPRGLRELSRQAKPFHPAPAPGVFPPPPPLPGSAGAVRAEALKVGSAYGELLADIERSLGYVQMKWGGVSVWDKMTPDEKARWAKEAVTRFEQLPALPRLASAELSAAQEEGFYAGVESGYAGGRLETFLMNLGTATAIVFIMAAAAGGLLAGSLLSRLLARGAGRAALILGGEGETMTLFRYAKVADDVAAEGWWTTRQAATRAEAARLTGVPENECLFEQRVLVNASPSKYDQYFKLGTPRSVGGSLIEEFRNKVVIPKSVIQVRSMPQ